MMDQDSSRLDLSLEEARERIKELAMGGRACHYHIGQLYNHVVRERLAEKGGYKSAQHYFSLHIRTISQAALSVYGKVARLYSEEVCATYGIYHLRLLLSYQAMRQRKKVSRLEHPREEDLGAFPIDVPRADGTVRTLPFAECSVHALRRAVKHQRELREASKPVYGTPRSQVEAARLQVLRESLAQRFAQGGVRLESRLQQGETLLSLRDVPLSQLERFIEALMEGLVPVRLVRTVG
jgi:hypothetical protein